jgi:hypothetical protein
MATISCASLLPRSRILSCLSLCPLNFRIARHSVRMATKRTMSHTSHIRFEKTIGQDSFQRKKEFLNAAFR